MDWKNLACLKEKRFSGFFGRGRGIYGEAKIKNINNLIKICNLSEIHRKKVF